MLKSFYLSNFSLILYLNKQSCDYHFSCQYPIWPGLVMAGGLSRLDHVYRSLLLTKFYTRGWGEPDHLRQIIKYSQVLFGSS